MQPAISIKNLGKQYHIGGGKEKYKTLRDSLVEKAGDARRSLKALTAGHLPPRGKHTFWALDDVSFDVQQGEVVGIVGRNGAGKSTLLKVLSRITEPTTGHADLNGRVGSLLEVGTGFHPELTGRDNIYLNGAILGMRKQEIDAKFDEIVAFSEIEKFIETPVKHYSSGMGLRLGFAVAAHLEPEILVVDEVLAVGDATFQQKCVGKMGDVARQGRTVLFVSHNMAAVEHLCSRAVMLEGGKLTMDGTPPEVIRRYLSSVRALSGQALAEREDRDGDLSLKFVGMDIRDAQGETIDAVRCGMDVSFVLPYESKGDSPKNVSVTVAFYDDYNRSLMRCRSEVVNGDFEVLPARGELRCRLPRFPLMPGFYSVMLACVVNGKLADKIMDALTVQVIEGDFYRTGKLPQAGSGFFLADYEWSSADV
jgi:lipopolysaccharide transport system ATP-binding protein